MRALLYFSLLLFFQKTIAQPQTSAGRWQADIAFLQKELPPRHPNFYLYYPQKTFEADLATLADNLAGKTDIQIALELQSIVAKVRDANTRLELTPLLQKSKVIPVGLGWYADGLYVSATVKKFGIALGKRVLTINGIPAEYALEKMGMFYAKENDEVIRKDGPQWLRFPEAFRKAGISENDTLELMLVDEKAQRYQMDVYPVDFQNEKDKSGLQPVQYTPKSPDLRWNPAKQMFSMNWLESDSIVYVQYNACLSKEMALAAGDSLSASQLPPFQPIVDSVFTLLGQHPGVRLFFDLRFNIGGDPADGIALADRIGSMPLLNLPNRVYVALNRYTAGAAVEIAAAYEKKTNATILGEPPAQRPNHFGDQNSFYLPNSRIQVFFGTRPVNMLSGNPEKIRLNVPLEMQFASFRDGRDPLLDFVRQLVVRRE